MEDRIARTIELVLSLIPPIKDSQSRQRLCNALHTRLWEKCQRISWIEAEPLRGSAARCITIFAGNMDRDLLEAFEGEGMRSALEGILQSVGEMAIWIDPDGVWYRINDRGVPQALGIGKPPAPALATTPRVTSAIPIVAPPSPASSTAPPLSRSAPKQLKPSPNK